MRILNLSPVATRARVGGGKAVEPEPEPEPEPVEAGAADSEPAGDDAESAGGGASPELGEGEAADDTAPPNRPTRWLAGILGLALVLLAALVTGGILLGSVLDHNDAITRRDAILSVANDVAQASYSLDYETFPDQVSHIIAATTGNYRQGLIDSTDGLKYVLTQGKVKSSCTITASGVERDDENTATVLLSITTRVTNAEIQVPQVRHYRVAIGLIRQGSQWLVQSNDVIA